MPLAAFLRPALACGCVSLPCERTQRHARCCCCAAVCRGRACEPWCFQVNDNPKPSSHSSLPMSGRARPQVAAPRATRPCPGSARPCAPVRSGYPASRYWAASMRAQLHSRQSKTASEPGQWGLKPGASAPFQQGVVLCLRQPLRARFITTRQRSANSTAGDSVPRQPALVPNRSFASFPGAPPGLTGAACARERSEPMPPLKCTDADCPAPGSLRAGCSVGSVGLERSECVLRARARSAPAAGPPPALSLDKGRWTVAAAMWRDPTPHTHAFNSCPFAPHTRSMHADGCKASAGWRGSHGGATARSMQHVPVAKQAGHPKAKALGGQGSRAADLVAGSFALGCSPRSRSSASSSARRSATRCRITCL